MWYDILDKDTMQPLGPSHVGYPHIKFDPATGAVTWLLLDNGVKVEQKYYVR